MVDGLWKFEDKVYFDGQKEVVNETWRAVSKNNCKAVAEKSTIKKAEL